MTYVSEEFYEQTTTTTYPAAGTHHVSAFPTPSADFGGDYYGASSATTYSPSSRFQPSSPLRSTSPTGTYRPLRTPPPIPTGYTAAAPAVPSPSFRAQPQASPYRSPTYHSPSFRSRSPVLSAEQPPVGSLYNSVAPVPADGEDYEYVYFRETRDGAPVGPSSLGARSPSYAAGGLSSYAPAPAMPPVDYDYAAPQPAFASVYATASPRYETSVSRFYGDDFHGASLRPRSPTAFDTRVSYVSPSFRPSSPTYAPAPAPLATYSPSFAARPSSPSFVRPSSPSFVRPSSPSFVSAAPLTSGQIVEEYEEYYSREEY